MGFSITALAQKARTQTLIVDSDLNMGQYDIMATDVIGDTADFTEFVGGVGNFSNVLGSGNLDIEGTGNIKGLTTFQNGVQINGALNVGGSINNVNIASNGEITTAQGVNGADFNGAKITATKFNGATIDTSGNVTGVKGSFSGAVTGTTGTFSGAVSGTTGTFSGAVSGSNFNSVPIKKTVNVSISNASNLATGQYYTGYVLLPYINGVQYTGKVRIRGTSSNTTRICSYSYTTNGYTYTNGQVMGTETGDITFTNAKCLIITSSGYITIDGINLS